ncbi:MAG: hypothetical protein GY694_20795 [Gammaproteobacteria bacterium]|nr:hypothetical protein [Gammaproteobacteria bacterium]
MKKAPNTVVKPLRSYLWGKMVQYSGFVVLITGLGLIFTEINVVLGLVIIVIGLFVLFFGMQLSSPSAEALLSKDPRAPIIFIRSFQEEQGQYSTAGFFHALKVAFMQKGQYASNAVSPWGPAFQIQLSKLLNEIGPYVAIGRPGENLSAMGAAKMYVSDDEWQAVISDLFNKAKLIVLRMGKTAGLSWELNELKKHIDPRKILFILPYDKSDYAAFRQWANKDLPAPFPEEKPITRFMILDDNWVPHELKLQEWLLDTLEPYFQNNGISRDDVSLWYKLINNWLFTMVISFLLIGLSIIAAAWLFA